MKTAGDKLCVLLCMVLNSLSTVCGHLPSGFMETIVISLVKDHKGDLSSVYNCIPIVTFLAKELMFLVALICLFVCLFVDNITQKVINGLG